jgi:hypothetical protein
MVAAKLACDLPSVERLQQVLRFDLEAGKAFWLTNTGGRVVGSEARSAHRTGYIYVQVDGCRFALHRAMWAVAHGRWPDHTVDHIDGDTRNNAISNLRDVSFAQNCLNRKTYKNNSTGHKGVYITPSGKWTALIQKSGKSVYLGRFDTKDAAAAAYQAAAASLHGEFSRSSQE